MVNKGELSKVSLERMPKNRAISYLNVKPHHCQYGNNYKISHGTLGCMPFRRVCLISGCALAMLHFIAAADFSLQVSIVAWSYISDLFHGALKKKKTEKRKTVEVVTNLKFGRMKTVKVKKKGGKIGARQGEGKKTLLWHDWKHEKEISGRWAS